MDNSDQLLSILFCHTLFLLLPKYTTFETFHIICVDHFILVIFILMIFPSTLYVHTQGIFIVFNTVLYLKSYLYE
jgi:hypothetical protein